MIMPFSPNTQAILLLTAPLIVGRKQHSSELLTPGEYKRLARFLRDRQQQPADLLSSGAEELLRECGGLLDSARLARLLARGFLLSQAVERWQTRAIWLVSRADVEYPARLKARLKDNAPPILYGCGDATILETGGLAVVGSRNVDGPLVDYTENIGRLTAGANRTLISGGARGVDQAAMRSTLNAGGKVIGVLASHLERQALSPEHREILMNGRLVLISPYDPAAGFNVGHAMQRNKLIYALSDAALVVSSDYQKGGTWAGAVEQLDKLKSVPVYVRAHDTTEKGLQSLQEKGALCWPDPMTPDMLVDTLAVGPSRNIGVSTKECLLFDTEIATPNTTRNEEKTIRPMPGTSAPVTDVAQNTSPADELFAKVRELLARMDTERTEAQVAEELQISRNQAKQWLRRLTHEGVLEKLSKPVRYRATSSVASLFND